MIRLGILDQSQIGEGKTASDALRETTRLAVEAEKMGYSRFWMSEHHGSRSLAHSSPEIMIAHVAAHTHTIRVGAGGVMLPNHAPLRVAEAFRLLEALHPGRIDLGLGRAPGTDMTTARALWRDPSAADQFPRAVQELQFFFRPAAPGQAVRAVPGAGLDVPIWLLGSSLFSAQLAAALGLPYAFAAHFAPDELMRALYLYRSQYKPSERHPRPYAMVCVNVVGADTDAEARRLFTSMQQAFTNIRTRGTAGPLPPPIDDIDRFWTPAERAQIEHTLRYSFVGSADTLIAALRPFLEATAVDELMITSHIYAQQARVRSIEVAAEVRDRL